MLRSFLVSFAAFVSLCLSCLATPTHEIVTSFETPPLSPGFGALTVGPDGKFWGTTTHGGAYNFGTIYRVDPATGDWKTLLSFTSNRAYDRGSSPGGALLHDGAGYLWGSTETGGANGFGTIFKYHVATGALTTLVDFTNRDPGNKGATAAGRLVDDGAGSYWGVTQYGGNSSGYGTVFKIDRSTGQLTTVVEFTSNGATNKGAEPLAGLVSDNNGFLWGSTSKGGANDAGTIFKINPATGVLTTVIEFNFAGPSNKGANPAGELLRDQAGFFWGTTTYGGTDGYGTVFKINIATGVLTTLVEFKNNSGTVNRGAYPYGQLVSDGAGSYWGTASEGGINQVGTVFKVNASTGALTSVFELRTNAGAASTGTNPKAGLLHDGSGFLWGTTGQGAQIGTDTIFKVNQSTGAFSTVVTFMTNVTANKGKAPYGGVVSDGKGFLWGTTRSGGPRSQGTIYKTNEISGETTTVVELNENGTRGAAPTTELLNDGAGFFWGTTEQGGNNTYGTVFKVNINTGQLTTLADFQDGGTVKGSSPKSGLVNDGAGFFWGTTNSGANDFSGTIYKINASTGAFTNVYQFSNGTTAANGEKPYGTLVRDGAGFLWGTTSQGGGTSNGTIYKVNISTGAVTRMRQLNPGNVDGANPHAGLASDGAGLFAGTAHQGGAGNFGTVFKIVASTGAFTKLVDFTSNGATNKGADPWGALVSDQSGSFLGTTNKGGANGIGTIFKVNATSGALTTLLEFTGAGPQANCGANPGYGALLRHTDGNYYGTTIAGGPGGAGTVFRIRFGPSPVTRPATLVTTNSATLQGTLNPNGAASAASFEWGTDPTLATSQVINAGTTNASTAPESISAGITGLLPGATYYYRARGTNADSTVPQRGAILSFATIDPDADHDGLPDEWEHEHFGNTTARNATDDGDKDGVVELLEYAFDLDPNKPDNAEMPAAKLEGGYLTITLSKQPGVTFHVETASSPASGSWSSSTTTVLVDNATTLTVRDNVVSSAADARFLHVRVSAP